MGVFIAVFMILLAIYHVVYIIFHIAFPDKLYKYPISDEERANFFDKGIKHMFFFVIWLFLVWNPFNLVFIVRIWGIVMDSLWFIPDVPIFF